VFVPVHRAGIRHLEALNIISLEFPGNAWVRAGKREIRDQEFPSALGRKLNETAENRRKDGKK